MKVRTERKELGLILRRPTDDYIFEKELLLAFSSRR